MTETTMETRSLAGSTVGLAVEEREGDQAPMMTGYAAVFDRQSEDLGGFIETIARGAFTNVLASNPDVRALVNHNKSEILGRTKSGTLRLMEDGVGLRYEIDVPNTVTARSVVSASKRGDIDGSSFTFRVAPGGDKWAFPDEGPAMRTVTEFGELLDVGPVTFPAYPDTTAASRSLETARAKECESPSGSKVGILRRRLDLRERNAQF